MQHVDERPVQGSCATGPSRREVVADAVASVRRTTAWRLVLTGAVPAMLLTGCGALVDPPAPTSTAAVVVTPSPAAAPASAPPADAAAVRAQGVAVATDAVTVLHVLAADPGTAVRAEPDGDQAVLTLDPGDAGGPVAAVLAVPAGAGADLQQDGSLVVRAPDGTFLGGAARPSAGPEAAAPQTTVTGDGLVRVEGTGPITLRVGSEALLGTDWGEREGGRSLAVEPSDWARTAGLAGEVAVWADLVVAEPEADTPVMHDQLVCHTVGAPDKATWNLEPWRPDVGLLEVMLAGCNPT